MHTEMRDTQPRADPLSSRVYSHLPLRERLAIAALVTGVTLWIRAVEIIPESSPLAIRARRDKP